MPVGHTLATTLREELGLTGTKLACGEGHCGACTVQLDGVPVLSCITLVHAVAGREVTTIEGLRDHPLVDAFVRTDALQCGFCTPGQIVSAAALVEAVPQPSRSRSGMRWRATSAAAAPIPGSRRRSRPGAADQDGEGGRGPLRGGVDARRGGRARAVAGRAGRGRRPARAPRRRVREGPRHGPLHGRHPLAGAADAALLRSPFARARVKRIDLAPALAAPGVLGAIGPGEVRGVGAETDYEGRPVAAVAAETFAQAEAAVALIDVEWEELEPLLDAEQAVRQGSLLDGDAPLRARRLRARPRRGGRGRRVRLRDADAQPQPARDAPVRL